MGSPPSRNRILPPRVPADMCRISEDPRKDQDHVVDMTLSLGVNADNESAAKNQACGLVDAATAHSGRLAATRVASESATADATPADPTHTVEVDLVLVVSAPAPEQANDIARWVAADPALYPCPIRLLRTSSDLVQADDYYPSDPLHQYAINMRLVFNVTAENNSLACSQAEDLIRSVVGRQAWVGLANAVPLDPGFRIGSTHNVEVGLVIELPAENSDQAEQKARRWAGNPARYPRPVNVTDATAELLSGASPAPSF